MIPKIIHFIWFGDKKIPKKTLRYINSWHKKCPDYKVIKWDEHTFDINKFPFAAEAYHNHKYAFVSDVARLWILVKYGGIYLDTDIKVLKSFDDLLNNKSFIGLENHKYIATCVIGAEPNNSILIEFLQYYQNKHFCNDDSTLNKTTNVSIFTNILTNKGLIIKDEINQFHDLTIYPTDWFCPKDYYTGKIHKTKNTHTIHYFQSSWHDKIDKKYTRLYKFFILFFNEEKSSKYAFALSKKENLRKALLNKLTKKGVNNE